MQLAAAVTSSDGRVWDESVSGTVRHADSATPAAVRVSSTGRAQRVSGFGGAFNEAGWAALERVPSEARRDLMADLFAPRGGCRLSLGRVPIGASDYALDWYSHDEVADDLGLAHFSIARDHVHLIPYIRAARSLNPDLRLWASPWSPPSWMKTNRHYACASNPSWNDLPAERAVEEMQTAFRMEPDVLDAYARYFSRFLECYRDAGLPIEAVHVQNEPNSAQQFPSCTWRPEDLATFIGRFLGPRLAAEHPDVSLWLGTIERPHIERIAAVLDHPEAAPHIRGVGLQWAGRAAIATVAERWPRLPLLQTENECGNGSNDWAAAEATWDRIRKDFVHGVSGFVYWNMVLPLPGESRWGWAQNAMVSVDTGAGTVRRNAEFYVMKHISGFVDVGAERLTALDTTDSALAFRNPDGAVVVIVGPRASQGEPCIVSVDGLNWEVEQPARAITTLLFR